MHIITETSQPLTDEEKSTLKKILDKKSLMVGVSYFVLAALLVAAYFWGLDEAEYGSTRGMAKVSGSEEAATRFQKVAPFVIAFFFILLTFFFWRIYRRSILPFRKYLKHGMKTVIYFNPESYKTPYFDTFYLRTGSRKKPMLRITRELFNAIQPGVTGTISRAPHSQFVLALEVAGQKMVFNERNTIIDI